MVYPMVDSLEDFILKQYCEEIERQSKLTSKDVCVDVAPRAKTVFPVIGYLGIIKQATTEVPIPPEKFEIIDIGPVKIAIKHEKIRYDDNVEDHIFVAGYITRCEEITKEIDVSGYLVYKDSPHKKIYDRYMKVEPINISHHDDSLKEKVLEYFHKRDYSLNIHIMHLN